MAGRISARRVLTPSGWLANCVVTLDANGHIESVSDQGFDPDRALGTLLPGVANLHSHSFQRVMAGLAERRSPGGQDDFWGWRQLMYRFLAVLGPDDIAAIAAYVQMQMAMAGFSAVAEFHYLHHQPDGRQYGDIGELSRAIFSASGESGIGLTHLPVLYSYGGLGARPLADDQRRFGCSIDQFQQLYSRLQDCARDLPGDFTLGVAPHSLRAVDQEGLEACCQLCPDGPIHIHVAEQHAEVDDAKTYLGATPVRWLIDNQPVNGRWCLIHATHMDGDEIASLAASGAVAGLCPTTEANLGDGIFPAHDFIGAGGIFGIGSDANIRISLAEELRMLELGQRLRHMRRTIMTSDMAASNGRYLYQSAAMGGAQAIGRNAGQIASGYLADLVALRDDTPLFDGADADQQLDCWIFAAGENMVSDVWSAGRHIIRHGQHRNQAHIERGFAEVMQRIRQAL